MKGKDRKPVLQTLRYLVCFVDRAHHSAVESNDLLDGAHFVCLKIEAC